MLTPTDLRYPRYMSKRVWLALIAVLLISGLAHGYGMFRFPYYENDEGVYVSQGWSSVSEGKLSPYTYWYDHAPAGWILIGVWQKLTGGPFTFGASVNSGRVLMLVLHLASTAVLFGIARKTSGRTMAGVIAGLIFGLSPLAVYFQRRVLLDNIATFWVLMALGLVIFRKLRLWSALAGAVCMGVAVLSKEVAIFFLPGFLVLLASRSGKNRHFFVILALVICGLVIATYPLFALLKGELFPGGAHVSLVGSLTEQLGRGVNLPFWNPDSLQMDNWWRWVARDPVLMWGGLVTMVAMGLGAIGIKSWRIPAILGWSFVAFLLRSSLIIDFYILPLIPFIAWGAGMVISKMAEVKIFRWSRTVIILLIIILFVGQDIGLYTRDETKNQLAALEYVKKNVPAEAEVAVDSSLFLDLRLSRWKGDPKLVNADWAWKIERDPEINTTKLGGDFRNINYVVISHEIMKQIKEFGANDLKWAVDYSQVLGIWKENSTSYLDLEKYISTNGDWMGLVKVNDRDVSVLENSWRYYKNQFIDQFGQVIDPAGEITTSEGQAYAMLRAMWMNDKDKFDVVWAWTRDHLRFRNEDKLFSWLWKDGKVADGNSASDADIDVAMALLLADKKWGGENYLTNAKQIAADVWRQEVKQINGRYYLTAGAEAKPGTGYLVNPSYFSPAAYRMFEEIDEVNQWDKLISDTYWLLDRISSTNKNALIPNWIFVDERTGGILNAQPYINSVANEYGYDAFRINFRIALDAKWNSSPEAKKFLEKQTEFFASEWENNHKIMAIYGLNGKAKTDYTSLSTNVGALAAFIVANPPLAEKLYGQMYEKKSVSDLNGYWGDKDNYYDQNWAWFGAALYTNNLWGK